MSQKNSNLYAPKLYLTRYNLSLFVQRIYH